MKKFYLLIINILICATAGAQQIVSEPSLKWDAEQVATRQTERICKELHITDSVLNDTLYQIYLYYAQIREKGLTREQNLQNLAALYEALRGVLSEEQYLQYMQSPMESRPRIPQNHAQQIHL